MVTLTRLKISPNKVKQEIARIKKHAVELSHEKIAFFRRGSNTIAFSRNLQHGFLVECPQRFGNNARFSGFFVAVFAKESCLFGWRLVVKIKEEFSSLHFRKNYMAHD